MTLLLGGGFYLAKVKKDPRFLAVITVIKKRELNRELLSQISSRRYDILLNGLVVIGRDFTELNVEHLLIGHGVETEKTEPQRKGFKGYESFIIVDEFIKGGVLGLTGVVLLFLRSVVSVLRFKVRTRDDVLVLGFYTFFVFYNLSKLFKPYIETTLMPLSLLMFGTAEVYSMSRSRQER